MRTILTLTALVALTGAAACDTEGPTALRPDAPAFSNTGEETELSAEDRRDLSALRRATAPFHQLDVAMAAGWDTRLTPCMEHPTDGAMGVHYANVELLDGTIELRKPETLVYEPMVNGRMRLVSVEYIVPFAAHPADAAPPELFGQHFHANAAAGIWGLHVWLWRHNPEGLFADWNPRVSCRFG